VGERRLYREMKMKVEGLDTRDQISWPRYLA